MRSTTTSATGEYQFSGLTDDSYYVVVDSKSVGPSQAFNSGFVQSDVWAEQTFGTAGSLYFDGSSVVASASDINLYGGMYGSRSDDASSLLTAEHVTLVTIAGTDVTDVDSAFSMNVVTNVLGGDNQDDSAGNRTVQGSIRQFILNANGIAGSNSMRFVPAIAANAGVAGDQWWRVVITEALPGITDASTTIDGRGWDTTNPSLQLNSNSGSLGTGGTVGVDNLALGTVESPELEIVNDRGIGDATAIENGLSVQASHTVIENLAIHGFGIGTNLSGNIRIGQLVTSGLTDIVIQDNIIGSAAHAILAPSTLSVIDAVAAQPNQGSNVVAIGTDFGILQNNLIAFASDSGLTLAGGTSNWNIVDNEIRSNASANNAAAGIQFADSSVQHTVSGNLITDHRGSGIDVSSVGQIQIANNTIDGNGTGGSQTAGIRLFGTNSTIFRNVVSNSAGAGVLVAGDTGSGSAIQNRISENTFLANGGVSIDLIHNGATVTDNNVGDGWTPNDNGTFAGSGNLGIDYPEIQQATFSGGSTTVSGTATPGATVEIYLADSNGVGTTLLGSTTADGGTGEFSLVLSGISKDAAIAATATDANNNTSEFSAAVNVNVPPTISNTVAGQSVSDEQTIHPFDLVQIADLDSGDLIDLQITLSTGDDDGQFSAASLTSSGFVKTGLGTYALLGQTPAAAQSAIRLLEFVPLRNQAPGGSASTTTFTILASDGTADVSDSTTTVAVRSVNDAPIATDNQYTISEDTSLQGNVIADDTGAGIDSDVDGDPLTATLTTPPSHGKVTLNRDGTFNYRPTENFFGSDSFEYTVTDPSGASHQAQVTIQVQPVNDAPVGRADTVALLFNQSLDIAESELLANDFDVDSTIVISGVDQPNRGTITVQPDGTLTYTAKQDFIGIDAFTYTITDGTLTSGPIQVEVLVSPPVLPPTPADPVSDGGSGDTVDEPADDPTLDDSPASDDDPNSGEPGDADSEPPTSELGDPNADGASEFLPDDVAPPPGEFGDRADDFNLDPTEISDRDLSLDSSRWLNAVSRQAESAQRRGIDVGLSSLFELNGGINLDRGLLSDVDLQIFDSTLLDQLDNVRKTVANYEFSVGTAASVVGVSTALTAGYVFWMVRSGVLLAGLASSMPAWQIFDPSAIVQFSSGGSADDDGESLEAMVDNDGGESELDSNPEFSEDPPEG